MGVDGDNTHILGLIVPVYGTLFRLLASENLNGRMVILRIKIRIDGKIANVTIPISENNNKHNNSGLVCLIFEIIRKETCHAYLLSNFLLFLFFELNRWIQDQKLNKFCVLKSKISLVLSAKNITL